MDNGQRAGCSWHRRRRHADRHEGYRMSDAIVAAFNAAASWEAVLTAIKSNAAEILDDVRIENLEYLANDADREQAVGFGIYEIKTLFGNFTSLPQIQALVKRQVDVEYAKYEFVFAFENANTV